MRAGGRVDPRAQRAHAAVVEAALGVFLDEGIGAVTIDAVAARSGVAKTTIYRRWGNRDELLLDVFHRFSLRLDVPPADLPPIDRLRAVVRQLAATLQTPEWQRAAPALFGAAKHRQELAGLQERLEHHQSKVVSGVLADAVAAGALPAETDVREALFQLLGPLLMAGLMRPETVDAAFADRLVELLFASRVRDGGPAPSTRPG